jgi:hypothetical protein
MMKARSLLLRRTVRWRFWMEAGLSTLSVGLVVLTLVVPDWIEAIFGIDPDQHSGSVEWAIVGSLLVAALVAGGLAGREWRRPRLAVRPEGPATSLTH